MVDDGSKLYAIADAGIYRELIGELDIENPQHLILFKDDFVREYENVAPYIIALDKDDPFTEKLISKGYGKTWLTFVISSREMYALAFELRELINVYSQKHEKEIIFRFYDPRNLDRYFKMLTQEDVQELFAYISGLFAYVDLEDNNKLIVYATQTKEVKLISKKEAA